MASSWARQCMRDNLWGYRASTLYMAVGSFEHVQIRFREME